MSNERIQQAVKSSVGQNLSPQSLILSPLPRRRALAFGAAALASAALAACGGGTATQTPKPAPTAVPATLAPAAPQAPAGAAASNPADVAARNNKYKSPPPMTIDKTKKYTATIVTNKGTMKADLFADTAPVTVNSFVFLANDHFYDGVIFHRIVPGFVIQGGDPTGTGMGSPGYKFPDEPSSFSRNYEKGTLAMANSGPNTNGSQFFICVDDLTAKNRLPKQYNIFGKVTDGLDVIDKLLAVPRTLGGDGDQSKPTERVFMQSVTISST